MLCDGQYVTTRHNQGLVLSANQYYTRYILYCARFSCVRCHCGPFVGGHPPAIATSNVNWQYPTEAQQDVCNLFQPDPCTVCLVYLLLWTPIRAGGYVPSSSASDDYLDALKSDSKQKNKQLHAKLSGRPIPPESQQSADAGPYEVGTSYDRNKRVY